MEPESTIDEITKSVESQSVQFPAVLSSQTIVLITHQSDVGKSSLINRVFGITDAVRGSHAGRMRVNYHRRWFERD
ncbi:hypothetical protein D9756_009850 [Leucocoprinus leucothites]|uniref:Uncharacterized protein n=1 Tax=Leucocoprinus leucothites TaxID=201217 RepID=A0A8H5CVZ5_9AGAR|nr:hypothetical protein D9756_009850 [Leucoagaricus leucothites]